MSDIVILTHDIKKNIFGFITARTYVKIFFIPNYPYGNT